MTTPRTMVRLSLLGEPSTSIIFASKDNGRKTLLRRMGLNVHVFDEDAPEDSDIEGQTENDVSFVPQERVQSVALKRARLVAEKHRDALVIAVAQVSFFNGDVLKKPDKPAAAQEMLKALSTKTFSIFTGLAFVHKASDRFTTCVEETKVTLGELTPHEISTYVSSGIAMNKCGAIDVNDPMGSLMCAGIIGDPNNLQGLPLRRLYRTLKKDFSDLFGQE